MSVAEAIRKTKGRPMAEMLEAMAIDRLSHGDARVPRSWSTVATYERLVAKGMVAEVEQSNRLIRQFTLIKSE